MTTTEYLSRIVENSITDCLFCLKSCPKLYEYCFEHTELIECQETIMNFMNERLREKNDSGADKIENRGNRK